MLLGSRGKGVYHEAKRKDAHSKIKKAISELRSAHVPITVSKLSRKASVSRKTVYKHLPFFEKENLVYIGKDIIAMPILPMEEKTLTELYQRLYERLKSGGRDPEQFCLVFTGNVPFSFGKDPTLLSQHILLEQNLRKRYLRDHDRFMEQFEEKHPRFYKEKNWWNKYKVSECIQSEIGADIGDYLRKLSPIKERAKRKEGIIGIFKVLYGFTNEILVDLQSGKLDFEEAIFLAGERGLTLKDLE